MHPHRFNRILLLIEHLANYPEGCLLSDLSRELRIAPSSVHDLLEVMLKNDVVTVGPGRRYRVGPRIVRLGLLVTDTMALRRVAEPYLRDLTQRLGDDVYLAVRAGDAVFYVDKYEGTQPVKVDVRLGEPRPLHCTSVGKLFLAFDWHLRQKVLQAQKLPRKTPRTITDLRALVRELDLISRTGLSVSREENVEGVIALAAPIWDATGTLVGAVSMSALRAHMPESRLPLVGLEIRNTALQITRAIGGRLPSHLSRGGESRSQSFGLRRAQLSRSLT